MKEKEKILYYITSLFTGLATMGIETSASRLLSPYFGSTNLIWATIITLIMLSLCLGNYLGGKLADKEKNADKLYTVIIISAIWVLVMPFFSKIVIMGSVIIGGLLPFGNAIQIASVLSCLILFTFPLTLLGMVSPYLAKLCINDLKLTGKVIGNISVWNTVGSIIGTILPTFVLIPLIGVKFSFLLFGIMLLALCVCYFIVAKKNKKKKLLATSIIIAIVMLASTNKSLALDAVIYEEESIYNYIGVNQEEEALSLKTNVFFGSQSVKNIDQNKLTGLYYDYFVTFPLFCKDFEELEDEKLEILILGYCAGTGADVLRKEYDINVTGIEIDDKIIEVAQKYFWDGEIKDNIIIDDGRNYLQNCDKKYDLVIIDVYQNISIPVNFTSTEFFGLCNKVLKDDGIIAMNIGLGNSTDSKLVQCLGQTLKKNVQNVYAYKTPIDNNVLIIGGNSISDLHQFNENLDKISDITNFEVCLGMKNNLVEINETKMILTDDLNNIELLEQEQFNKIIREELHIEFVGNE
ncbi:fused MFS/spermidine synthase [Candidatus Ventrimonas sp. KK005]|uniref:spermidine synthase n=1 Tax=uncultured Clostridium sp. TaxID=59620 RepID=UPI001602B3B3|nr:fused MFS/spermidine synthase [uncultured Clostridium sp.]MCI8948386.1 fused MFS/spermidine synthase [Lachnospiraceae bacterium]